MKKALFIGIVLLLASGCGSNDGDSTSLVPTVDVSGDWSGDWFNGEVFNCLPCLSFSVTQDGSDLSGVALINTSTCSATLDISGSISGNSITITAFFGDQFRMDFDGTVVNNQITGNYEVTYEVAEYAFPCPEFNAGDSGTWAVSRL